VYGGNIFKPNAPCLSLTGGSRGGVVVFPAPCFPRDQRADFRGMVVV